MRAGFHASLLILCLAVPSRLFAHVAIKKQIEALSRQIDQSPGDAALYLKRGELHRVAAHQKTINSERSPVL